MVPITFLLHHSFNLMSSPIDRIFMETLDKICCDHHQHFNSFQDTNRIQDVKYHPCPRWFVLSSTILLPSAQHKLVRVLCYTLSSLLSSICASLPGSVTVFYVKDVVRISPPLKNSCYSDASCHHNSFLGPRVEWTLLCEFKNSSNPIALKLMVDSSFLDYWFLNRHSDVGRATQPIFRVHLSTNV